MTGLTDLLTEGAFKLGVELTPEQVRSFMEYMELLLEWNGRMNLTAITDREDIVVKHFLDSLSAAPYLKGCVRVADVGSGAGFPGIPVKIALPETRVTLLDSLRKRLVFLEAVKEALALTGVETVHARAEEAGRQAAYRGAFDGVTSRAVAETGLLAEYCLPLVAAGGVFVAMKGPKAAEELKTTADVISALGGEVERVDSIEISGGGEAHSRTLIIIRKIRGTPPKYPRKTAELKKIYGKTV